MRHDSTTPETRLATRLAQEGWAWRAVSARRAQELWAEIEERRRDGAFDDAFFEERLAPFAAHCASPPEEMPTLLILAVPDPWTRLRFTWHRETVETWIPPTFLGWREAETRALEAIRDAGPWQVASAPVPKKLLAARSGLARYGRNNVTYVPEHGSYVRLISLYTDIPLQETRWDEPATLAHCAGCGACVAACPAAALDDDRFLVHAERCLTFWNEKPREIPFPDSIPAAAHHCLLGCARCQEVCPANAGARRDRDAGEPFTEDQTQELLAATTEDRLSPTLREALRRQGLLEALETLPRNLTALLRDETPT
ncbi:MAG: 4Fe-4S dicluster domain-containing protein [Candidatus Bipolaricaulota bacterium]|nr:MAG: 4Fe-4S dicluster domain-containing protein [Candidatus Bipolaricaulota bacterium]